MTKIKRRRFLGIVASTVAVAAIPAVAAAGPGPAIASQIKAAVGTEFYCGVWINTRSVGHAIFATRPDRITALRRAEIEWGMRLGRHKTDVTWHGDRGAWFVMTEARVVGYA